MREKKAKGNTIDREENKMAANRKAKIDENASVSNTDYNFRRRTIQKNVFVFFFWWWGCKKEKEKKRDASGGVKTR